MLRQCFFLRLMHEAELNFTALSLRTTSENVYIKHSSVRMEQNLIKSYSHKVFVTRLTRNSDSQIKY